MSHTGRFFIGKQIKFVRRCFISNDFNKFNKFNKALASFVCLTSDALRGCLYGSQLARLGGLARLGEMIFIPRSYGIFYLSSIKKLMSREKNCLMK